MTYGFAPDAMVRADAIESAGADGMRFDLVADGQRRPVTIPTLGRLAVHNALAAAAVGLASGFPPGPDRGGARDGLVGAASRRAHPSAVA